MPSFLTFLAVVFAALTLGLLLFTLHKVRRVHHNSFELLEHARATRTEVESLFSQLQALVQLDRTLNLPKGLPGMRGWAGSPDFLLYAARHVLEHKPMVAVECGSGASTVVLARAMQLAGQGRVYSLEHEAVYARKTRDLLRDHGLQDWAEVIEAPLVPRPSSTPWYDTSAFPAGMRDIDLLVVDGPPEHVGRLARYPALPTLLPRMAAHFTVLVDDAARPDETEMVARWTREVQGTHSCTVPAEKGLTVVQR